ncbi:lactadherin-like [Branchiostoma floridae x Branchiostoma japonicum]
MGLNRQGCNEECRLVMAILLKKLTIVTLIISGFGTDTEASLCYAPLGMAEGHISDCEITASSRFDYFRAPNRARLNGAWGTGGYAGAWCAAAGDSNPWIQVEHFPLHITNGNM